VTLTLSNVQSELDGSYQVIVISSGGSITSDPAIFTVIRPVYGPGLISGWGSNTNGALSWQTDTTNVISIAGGKAHGIAAMENGCVASWGSYWTGSNYVTVFMPSSLTNAIAVAAGSRHDLALEANGRVIAWGLDDASQTNVPGFVTNIIAVAAGGQQSLALQQNGTVFQWGNTNAPIPAGLTNVTAIVAGTNFALALQNSTVAAWGLNDYGQTNIPSGLSNVVAIAAGGAHALALKADGTVTAWGSLATVPAGLSNVMNVAAGENHDIALKNDGTVVCWGDDISGQTNVISGISGVKLIAGGGDFTLASEFSTTAMYPIDATKDLLLIYNTNSQDSTTVLNYYLAHRPMVSNANVLPVGWNGVYITNGPATNDHYGLTNTTDYETIDPVNFTNQILNPILNWLAANPTKRPQYMVMMLDMPSRISYSATNTANFAFYANPPSPPDASLSYDLSIAIPALQPFITFIDMNGTNDCKGYIDKLQSIGDSCSPGKLVISAGAGGYGNTNFVLDGIRTGTGYNLSDYTVFGYIVSNVTNSLTLAGILATNILFFDGTEIISNGFHYNLPHPTGFSNIAGYTCWGAHSSLGGQYAANGAVAWSGNSGWWLIRTMESYNGQRYQADQCDFVQWFSTNAFGGTGYSNTPIGAITYVDEPRVYGTDNTQYFGLWAANKNFAVCVWNSNATFIFQAVGDPFVIK